MHTKVMLRQSCVGSQGDMEKSLGLSVSPLMDRTHKGGITRSQVRLTILREMRGKLLACGASQGSWAPRVHVEVVRRQCHSKAAISPVTHCGL